MSMLTLATVQPAAVQFLWNPYIPLSKLTLLAADPGLGKTTLTLALAAHLSTATPLPYPPTASPLTPPSPTPDPAPLIPSSTVFLSPEDNVADTLRPRLDALHADSSLIHILPHFPALYPTPGNPTPLAELRELLLSVPHLKLLVIDPVTHYLGLTDRKLSPHVRSCLFALAELAADLSIAVLLTTRLTKSLPRFANHHTITRTLGSLAFAAAARSVLLLASDPQLPQRRLIIPVKSNLTALPNPLAFTLQPSPPTPDLTPLNPPSVTLLFESASPEIPLNISGHPAAPTKPDFPVIAACQFLKTALAQGPLKSTDIQEAALTNLIALRTLERAKAQANILSVRDPSTGLWYWSLPNDPRPLPSPAFDRLWATRPRH